MHRGFLPFVLAAAACFAVRPALADFRVCNRTSYVVYAATAVPAGANVDIRGWARMIPGDCATAIAGDLQAPDYFVYARTSRAHQGPPRAWGGNRQFCARDPDFAIQMSLRAACASVGASPLPFAAIDTHRAKSWMMTLTESDSLPTLDAARLAGLKRLLHDNGLKTGAFDSRPDRAAAASLVKYRARRPLAVTAKAADLFDLLEADALKAQAPAPQPPAAPVLTRRR